MAPQTFLQCNVGEYGKVVVGKHKAYFYFYFIKAILKGKLIFLPFLPYTSGKERRSHSFDVSISNKNIGVRNIVKYESS